MARATLVQDWFFAPGGAERVADELLQLIPTADVHTSFADRGTEARLKDRLHTWPLQRLVGPTRRYRAFLPVYPIYFGTMDLRRYDLVVSSCSAFAKAVRTRPDATHIAYIHTPMRYAWDREGYLASSTLSRPARAAARLLHPALKRWDRRMARRPDILVANSRAVQDRIRRFWSLESELIHPPVAIDDIAVSDRDDGFLLVVSRVFAYRRLDLLVRAATALGRPTIVAGDGPELASLRSIAGPTIEFVGAQQRPAVIDLLSRCHAYVAPGDEAFGIAPVEAQAAGKPVVAFRAGGALETVVDGRTGVLFDRQTPGALAEAIERLDSMTFDRAALRSHAERFAAPIFRERFAQLFERLGVARELYRAG
jgi:glycosyltransferase involved in cell wall biosynthesis